MRAAARTRAALAATIFAYVDESAGSRSALPAAGAVSVPSGHAPRSPLHLGGIAKLLEAATHLLDDDAVGLHFAVDFDLSALGPFTHAVLHAPTVGTALRNITRYSEMVTFGVRARLDVDADTASLVLPQWLGDPGEFRHLDEAAVVVFVRMLRRLAGPGWSPIEIWLRHPEPADTRVHHLLLGKALRFDRPSSRILLARADLDRRVPEADRLRRPLVERHLQQLAADRDDWRQEVELQIASLVCDGHPSIRQVARRAGTSPRTLQRRLEARGLTYRDLVASVRLRIARQYLQEGKRSLGEIAFLLGYSELSAFDRAYRRWTGHSPGSDRRRSSPPVPSQRARVSVAAD